MTLMPSKPVPSPSKSSPRSTTASLAFGTLTMMPLVPETSTPASNRSEEMVIALVMVTAPKPPGLRALISPPVAVLEIAPAKVLQGAVRLHGFASSPTPETQVRVACACASVEKPATRAASKKKRIILEWIIEVSFVDGCVIRQLILRMRTLTQKRQRNFTRNQTPLDYSLRQGRTELPLRQDLTLEPLLDIPFFRELKPTSPVPRLS